MIILIAISSLIIPQELLRLTVHEMLHKTSSVRDLDIFKSKRSSKRNSSCADFYRRDNIKVIVSTVIERNNCGSEIDINSDINKSETNKSHTILSSSPVITRETKSSKDKTKKRTLLVKGVREFISKTRNTIQLTQQVVDITQKTRNVYLMVDSVDIKRVNDTAAFYLSQIFTGFPLEMSKLLLERETSFSKAYEFLKDRGWNDTDFSSYYSFNAGSIDEISTRERSNSMTPVVSIEDLRIPKYYFGRWSYDCTFAFEGKQSGSYMTCFDGNDYYIVYKGIQGELVPIPIGTSSPVIPESMFKKHPLLGELYRPPKRSVCTKCPGKVPCIAPIHRPHFSNIVPYPIPLLPFGSV